VPLVGEHQTIVLVAAVKNGTKKIDDVLCNLVVILIGIAATEFSDFSSGSSA
jgi:hypothetical protein